MTIKKAVTELTDLELKFVSMVPAGANGLRKFMVIKQDDGKTENEVDAKVENEIPVDVKQVESVEDKPEITKVIPIEKQELLKPVVSSIDWLNSCFDKLSVVVSKKEIPVINHVEVVQKIDPSTTKTAIGSEKTVDELKALKVMVKKQEEEIIALRREQKSSIGKTTHLITGEPSAQVVEKANNALNLAWSSGCDINKIQK